MENESSLTLTVTRNSDGKIINIIQCNAIVAGLGITTEAGSAYVLAEHANGGMILSALECAEKAIAQLEDEREEIKLFRKLKKMASKIKEVCEGESDDEE